MANNPSNHIPSFQEWFNEMIDDLEQTAVNLYIRANNEFLPKVAVCAAHDLEVETVRWTDIVNGVANTIAPHKPDLAKTLVRDLCEAVMFPNKFIAERAQLMTLEEEMAIILGDMDSE